MSTPEELQQQAKLEYSSLVHKKGAVGQFKQIVPMTDDIAVAVVRASAGIQAKNDLEHEVALLKVLKEHGFPALQTYGDVFEIADGKHAVVMDWVPNANLIDGKAPEMINYLLPALMFGVPINTGDEAWAIKLPQISRGIVQAAAQSDPKQVQRFAMNLSEEIARLLEVIDKQKLVVADLQILIDPKGKLTIIDPLDVLRVVPKKPPVQGFDLVDIMDPSKPNSDSFVKSLFKSMEMLENMKKICDRVAANAESKPALQALVKEMMSARPSRGYSSAPVSPVMPRANVVRKTKSEPSSPTGGSRPVSPSKPEVTQPRPKRLIQLDPKKRPASITPAATASAAASSASPLNRHVAKEDAKPSVSEANIERPIKPKPKSG